MKGAGDKRMESTVCRAAKDKRAPCHTRRGRSPRCVGPGDVMLRVDSKEII